MAQKISTIIGDVEVGLPPRQYSEADYQQLTDAETQLKAAGMDFTTVDGVTKNSNLVSDYLQANRNVPVTVSNIILFVNANNTSFVWRTPAQQQFDRVIATEGRDRAQQMLDYLAGQRQLVNSGEELHLNAAELLQELHGREINKDSIQQAIGRISAPTSRFDTRHRNQLHFNPNPRKVNPRQHQDDNPNRKTGQFIEGANKTPADYAREREEALAKNRPSHPESLAKIEARAKTEAESLRGNTHSQDTQLARVFVSKPNGEIDWCATAAARKRMQAGFSYRSIG
jgi:hypothetical protein